MTTWYVLIVTFLGSADHVYIGPPTVIVTEFTTEDACEKAGLRMEIKLGIMGYENITVDCLEK